MLNDAILRRVKAQSNESSWMRISIATLYNVSKYVYIVYVKYMLYAPVPSIQKEL